MAAFKKGDVALNRFEIKGHLGEGCFGPTYLAVDRDTPTERVVLKVVEPTYCQRAGLVNSLTVLGRSSKNLSVNGYVPISDLRFVDPYLVYIRPFIEGQTLRHWLSKALDFKTRMYGGLEILHDLSILVDDLHTAGHFANLKPENIFLDDEKVYLTDSWNAAFIPPVDYNKKKQAARYLPYLAPELKKNWAFLTPASDYYSLGSLLHEILLGKAPVPSPLVPSQKSKLYDAETDDIIRRVLEADPEKRTSDSEAWLLDIKHLKKFFKLEEPEGNSLPEEEEAEPVKSREASNAPDGEDFADEMEKVEAVRHFEEPTPASGPKPLAPKTTDDSFLEEEEAVETAISHLSSAPASIDDPPQKNQPVFNKVKKAPKEEISDDMSRFRKKVHLPPAQASKKSIPTWVKILLILFGIMAVGGSILLGVVASTLWK